MSWTQKLSDQFDNDIASLVNSGRERDAILEAKKLAVHALTVAYGLHLRRGERKEALKPLLAAEVVSPDDPHVQLNLSYIYSALGELDKALDHTVKGSNLPNAPAEIFYNLGMNYKNRGKLKDAARAFSVAVELDPDCAITRCQYANVLLAMGRFDEGLTEDEWRFKAHSGLRSSRVRFSGPDWDGKADLHGKRVIVYNEQGLGDGINFARYLPEVKKRGAYVLLEIQKELAPLFDRKFVDEIIERKDYSITDFPQHDYVIPMGSFMYLFDKKLDKIPMEVPYLYPTYNDTPATELIKSYSGKYKVGIIWAGSPWHTNDKERTLFLKEFLPLSEMPQVQLFSLQKGNMQRTWTRGKNVLWEGNEEFDVVNLDEGCQDMNLVNLSDHLNNFNDTANILKSLDLLITVDTSTAHLAGAIGTPVWLLLPAAHEWRWLKNWYPTIKVFKQPKVGDWQGLMANVRKELTTLSS